MSGRDKTAVRAPIAERGNSRSRLLAGGKERHSFVQRFMSQSSKAKQRRRLQVLSPFPLNVSYTESINWLSVLIISKHSRTALCIPVPLLLNLHPGRGRIDAAST